MFLDDLGSVFKEPNMDLPDINGMMQMMARQEEELQKPWRKFW